MKLASAKTLAILAGGKYLKFEFWEIQRTDGQTFFYGAGDSDLTVGGNAYKGGLVFVRDEITTKLGTEVQSLDLTISPQFDYPGGPGAGFLSQLRQGLFDNAVWTMSKGFFLPSGSNPVTDPSSLFTYTPPPKGSQLDTSPGLVSWWQGITGEVQAGRQSADITLDDTLSILANQQMPRNMVQQGCLHELFDTFCTVPQAQNTYTDSISSVSGNTITTHFTTGAGFVSGFFNQGIITYTSGVLSGQSFTIQSSAIVAGVVTLTPILPLLIAPSPGDNYSIVPGCDKTTTMCKSGKFKNGAGTATSFILHFRGYPFVPQPETLFDGGTASPTPVAQGGQGKPGVGSPFTGLKQL